METRPEAGFVPLDERFRELIGPSASLRLLLDAPGGSQLFHEAGVHLPRSRSVWLSSNRLPDRQHGQAGKLLRVPLDAIPPPSRADWDAREPGSGLMPPLAGAEAEELWGSVEVVERPEPPFAMPNGATPYSLRSERGGAAGVGVGGSADEEEEQEEAILWCEQGRDSTQSASCLVLHRPSPSSSSSSSKRPGSARAVISSYDGRPFSSLNDVVQHAATGAVLFTDPDYGVEQQFRDRGVTYAPNALYVAHLATGEVRLLDDRYEKPNGVTFLPSSDPERARLGGGTLFTTDTSRFRFKLESSDPLGDFYVDEGGAARVYAYTVHPSAAPAPAAATARWPEVDVASRRLLAESTSGVPDGIHADSRGVGVWVGHGDGVHVYDAFAASRETAAVGRGVNGGASSSSSSSSKLPLLGKVVLPGGRGVANFCWAGEVEGVPHGRQLNGHATAAVGEGRGPTNGVTGAAPNGTHGAGSDGPTASSSAPPAKGAAQGAQRRYWRMLLFAEDQLWEAIVGVDGRD